MALSGSVLGAAVAAAINSLSEGDKEDVGVIWETVCTEIINHIVSQGIVTTTVTTVVAGTSPSGPVTGTGTGTGTGTIA